MVHIRCNVMIQAEIAVISYLLLDISNSLQVNIPPVITIAPERHVLFVPGRTLTLPCEASGSPPPQYHWVAPPMYKVEGRNSSTDVVLGGASGALTLSDTSALVEGWYECWAQNDAGKDWSSTFVQMAYLEPFATIDRARVYAELGSYLILRCPQVQSMPLPEISWLVDNNGSMVDYHTNDRVVQDLNGHLHFTSIEFQDSKELYSCCARNNIVRSMVLSQEYSIVIRSGEYNGEMSLEWHSDSDPAFYVGEMIKLQCIFSGSQPPNIRWDRLGTGLPLGRSYTEAGDTVLVVLDVQSTDAGQYECIAYSDFSDYPVTHTFNVLIQAQPEIIQAPLSVNATEGSNVTFQCDGSTNPEPQSSWYIDGQLIYTSAGRAKDVHDHEDYNVCLLNDTHLSVCELTVAGSMTVSCRKTQGELYDRASAYLSVRPQHATVTGIGHHAVSTSWLLCLVYASGTLLSKPLI